MHAGKVGTVRAIAPGGNDCAWVYFDEDPPTPHAAILDTSDPRNGCVLLEARECDPITQHPSFPDPTVPRTD